MFEYAGYYNYHLLHGEIDWLTQAERYGGTLFIEPGLPAHVLFHVLGSRPFL